MLIRGAEVDGRGLADLRLAEGRISAIGQFTPLPDEPVIEARGGALLPGLHDHHLHLAASAVRAQSILCGTPDVTSAADLAVRLALPGTGWLRGIGYHESVMDLPDRHALDRMVQERPLRMQHRSGRMWLLNTAALDLLLDAAPPPPGLERDGTSYTGRLFDEDAWLQIALAASPPDFGAISAELAGYGVTGITDMSPRNDATMARHFASQIAGGAMLQQLVLGGNLTLGDLAGQHVWRIGPAKIHLHEAAFPDFDETVAFVRSAHEQGRPVASHCTTEAELVFTLAAFDAAGAIPGDRIEHAGIARDSHIAEIARLGLAVVSQPHFITERGDHYRADVEPELVPLLYRLKSFVEAGIPLAAGSDAPFGGLSPWNAMAAAINRTTTGGALIGENEALSPEQALDLYLADPLDLTRTRRIGVGEPADLCLLDAPWREVRGQMAQTKVAATLVSGRIVHQGIDQSPVERFGSR